jgi:hypothetical protein
MKDRSEKTNLCAEDVLKNLELIRANAMKVVQRFDKNGNRMGEDFNDMNAALKSLELMGRHLAMWTDKTKITGDLAQDFRVVIKDGAMTMVETNADHTN